MRGGEGVAILRARERRVCETALGWLFEGLVGAKHHNYMCLCKRGWVAVGLRLTLRILCVAILSVCVSVQGQPNAGVQAAAVTLLPSGRPRHARQALQQVTHTHKLQMRLPMPSVRACAGRLPHRILVLSLSL